MNTNVLFFVPEWPASDSGVLESQVLAVASFLSQKGFRCLFIGTERSAEQALKSELIIRQRYRIQAHIFGFFPAAPTAIALLHLAYRTFIQARSLARAFAPTHIYARSCVASLFGRRLAHDSDAVSIYDVRAVLAEEISLGRSHRGVRSLAIDRFERHEMRKAERLATVSHRLGAVIQERSGRSCHAIIPSCYDQESFFPDLGSREAIRAELGASRGEKILCYAGGMAPWQRVGDIISLFEEVAACHKHVRFVILTPHSQKIASLLASSSHPARYTVTSCSHDKVRRYLSACDVGIIMRHDTIVNNVASPIKVAEYLACGLPVVMTRGIGDYSDELSRNGVGMLLDEGMNLAAQVIAFLSRPDFDDIRASASRYARAHLTLDANWDRYQNLYRHRSELLAA